MEAFDNSVPEYINFLLDPSTPLDFQVKVQNPDGSPTTINAVKWMLIARSPVLRVSLFKSKMRHEKDFTLVDIDSVTFKHFLVFLYGHDHTSSLSLEESLKLLYTADKYEVEDLKGRLGSIIKPQVNIANIFIILRQALVCEKIPDLWEAITEVIQFTTEDLFSNEQFVTVSPEVLLHIVQQDQLSVPEVEVWRAALTWARHQDPATAAVVSPDALRCTMLPFLKHIRLCSLSRDELCGEVLPTKVLTTHETAQICASIATQKKCNDLKCLSNEIEKRGIVCLIEGATCLKNDFICTFEKKESLFSIITHDKPVALYAIECQANVRTRSDMPPEYRCRCTVDIRCFSNIYNSRVTVFDKLVEYGKPFIIPFLHNRDSVLNANSFYRIGLTFEFGHPTFCSTFPFVPHNTFPFQLKNFSIHNSIVDGIAYKDVYGRYYSLHGSHFMKLYYKELHNG